MYSAIRLFSAVTVAISAAAAHAQSFNIDFDESPGEAASAPVAAFPGAINQPGLWNAVPASHRGPLDVLDTSGLARGIIFDRSGGEGGFTFDNPATTGEHHFLLDDIVDAGFQGSSTLIRLRGLLPGRYRVITYAISPDNPATDRTSVFIEGATGPNPQAVGGPMPANAFAGGITHADHDVLVDDSLLTVRASASTGYGSVNGMQVQLVSPRRLFVRPDAPPGGDGAEWSRAVRTLGEALARAASSAGVVREVWVARGTYRPSSTNPAATFTVPPGVRVYGGFVGNEASLSRRDITVYRTILSGRLEGGARSRRIVVLDGGAAPFTAQPPALDGFIIEDGGGSGPDTGGVKIIGRGDVVRSILRSHAGVTGGAIFAQGETTLVACEFVGNSAADGAAVYATGAASITNCIFHANTASGRGGAVYLAAGGDLTGAAVWGNTAAQGAGVYIAAGPLTLINSTIALNSAPVGAGVLRASPTPATLSVQNSILYGNRESRPVPAPLREQNLTWAPWPIDVSGARNLIEGYAVGPLTLTSDADPIFTDPLGPDGAALSGDENIALFPGSPAIDAGDSALLPADAFDLDADGDTNEPLPTDAANKERLTDDPATPDTGCCAAPVVDLGAIEFLLPPSCPADFNEDGGVDGADVEAFYLAWQEGDVFGDVNQDGGVDGADVEFFFLVWEAGGC